MRVPRSDAIAVVEVAACAVSYRVLALATELSFGESVRPNVLASEHWLRDRATPTAADRIRDTFEKFPDWRRSTVRPGNRRDDGIMFAVPEQGRTGETL